MARNSYEQGEAKLQVEAVNLSQNITVASRVGWAGPVFYFYKNIQKGQWRRALSGSFNSTS
jgi:hypothetical protein